MLAPLLFAAPNPALAADAPTPPHIPVADGGFVVKAGSGAYEVRVRDIGLPKPLVFDNRFRVCRVTIAWKDGAWTGTRRDGCHPNVADSVDEAVKRWVIDVPKPPERDRDLFEFWYLFPGAKGQPVQVRVRQAFDTELVVAEPLVDVLEWRVEGRLFPEFPPEALTQNTEFTTCTAKIDIAPTGVPGDVVVDGCDEVFRGDLVENLRSWRFGSPELDNVPFWSGVTLGFRFVKPIDEGAQGTVETLTPPDPNRGARTQVRTFEALPAEEPARDRPTWPPLFEMDHRSFASVVVYDLRWPEVAPLDHEATCDILFQVNSKLRVWAWSEGCDEAIRPAVEAAASAWYLAPGKIDKGERFARFRGTFVVPADGSHVRLRLPIDDVVTEVGKLPEYIDTYRRASTLVTVPPTLPRGFATEITDPVVTCEYDVEVDRKGRPATVSARSCPGGLAEYAEKAVDKWRWTPAEADGQPISSHVTVRIRFDLGVKGSG